MNLDSKKVATNNSSEKKRKLFSSQNAESKQSNGMKFDDFIEYLRNI